MSNSERFLVVFILIFLSLVLYLNRTASIEPTEVVRDDNGYNLISLPNKTIFKSARYIPSHYSLNVEVQIVDENKDNWLFLYSKNGKFISKTKIIQTFK